MNSSLLNVPVLVNGPLMVTIQAVTTHKNATNVKNIDALHVRFVRVFQVQQFKSKMTLATKVDKPDEEIAT